MAVTGGADVEVKLEVEVPAAPMRVNGTAHSPQAEGGAAGAATATGVEDGGDGSDGHGEGEGESDGGPKDGSPEASGGDHRSSAAPSPVLPAGGMKEGSQEPDPSSNPASDDNDEPPAARDERKQKRMLSNRESARRSRLRKQRHLDELRGQVAQLRAENHDMQTKYGMASRHFGQLTEENRALQMHAMELSRRLQQLHHQAAAAAAAAAAAQQQQQQQQQHPQGPPGRGPGELGMGAPHSQMDSMSMSMGPPAAMHHPHPMGSHMHSHALHHQAPLPEQPPPPLPPSSYARGMTPELSR